MPVTYQSGAVTAPVLLDEVKDHIRLTGEAEDSLLAALVEAATAAVERASGLTLLNREVTAILQSDGTDVLMLPVRPIGALQSVSAVSPEGAKSPLDAAAYRLEQGLFPRLRLLEETTGRLEIACTVGFGADWNAAPPDLRQAVLLLVAHLYENRGENPGCALRDSGAADLMTTYRELRL